MNDRPRQQITTLIAITLTFGSGAMDVASFTRLGNAFTSVMTGNIVLGGLAAVRGSTSLASHAAVAIAGYLAGVASGTWIAHGFGAADPGGDTSRARVLPAHIRWVLLAELILLAGFTLGWEVTRASRAGWAEFTLLAVAAEAMGVQAAAVKETGLTDVSTTFLTGTLTGLVSSLASPGQDTPHGVRRLGVLLGLLAGAGLSGLLIATASASAPALTLAALVIALALASVPLPLTRSAVPGQGGQQDHGKKEPGAGTPSDAK